MTTYVFAKRRDLAERHIKEKRLTDAKAVDTANGIRGIRNADVWLVGDYHASPGFSMFYRELSMRLVSGNNRIHLDGSWQ